MGGAMRDSLGLKSEDLQLGLNVASNRLRRGANLEALRIYLALVLCEPANAEFQVGLSNCALLLQEHSLALRAASVVIALEPKNPKGYLLSGRACIALGHFTEADEDLRKAMQFAKEKRESALFQSAESLLKKLSAITAH